MTERTLELSLLLPRAAECGGCVDEVGRELLRLDGIHDVEPDVSRGLLRVGYDEAALAGGDVETFARRAGAQAHCEDHCPLAVHEHGPLDLSHPLAAEDAGERRILHVTGMDCADCAVKLQGALRRERGVRSADVNFGAATLAVAIDPSQTALPEVFRAVRRLGYDTVERRAADDGGGAQTAAAAARAGRGFWLSEPRAVATLVSGAFTVAGFVATAAAPAAAPWLFGAAVVSGGVFVARAAVFSLRGRQVDMNVLMTLAMIGAAAIGQWSEAALVAFLFSLGTVLQVATLERTRRAISGLMRLAPPTATVLRPCEDDGELEEKTLDVADILVGDVVIVRPGERAAVDGVVVEGAAAADQAPVTGESVPVGKGPGDQVFAGSIIEGGTLRVRATAAASDTTIAKIVHMVEEAQAQRAPAETIVDRFASKYTPVVVALAAAVAFVPPLLGASFDTWFYRGLALLIISCPCALVISTPVSILAALARATRNGVLIKGGAYLEQMAGIKAVAFDKTGTLTLGRPQVTDVVPLNGASPERVLAVAAALERYSEHPLARAITERASLDGSAGAPRATRRPAQPVSAVACSCEAPGCCAASATEGAPDHGAGDGHDHAAHDHAAQGPDVERFRAIPGRGVRAELDGRLHFAGRPDLLGAHGADPALTAVVERLEREGKTAVVVGDEDRRARCRRRQRPPASRGARGRRRPARAGGDRDRHADRRQPGDGARRRRAGRRHRRPRRPPAGAEGGRGRRAPRPRRRGRHGRRRRQRRTGAGGGDPRRRHGRRRHRRRPRDRRYRPDGRRPLRGPRHDPPGAQHHARHLAEHRLLDRRQGGLPRPRAARSGQPVAGRLRRHGHVAARHGERPAPLPPSLTATQPASHVT